MMYKKLIIPAVSAALLLAAAPSAAFADGDTLSQSIDGINYLYRITEGKAELITIQGAEGDIDIPTALGGYEVASIAGKAFFKNEDITRVILPSTLKNIGDSAFSGCLALSRVYIPNSVTAIGSEAFMSCTSLKTVTVGSSVTVIPDGCFYSCPSLTEANLPDGLRKIGAEAFFGCPSLNIDIPESVSDIGMNALGMQSDARTGQIIKSSGFLMSGKKGSCAELYAAANGVDFIDMDSYLTGDVDNNGKIDAADASDVLSEYARASTGAELTFSPRQRIVGDMNGDKNIDSMDASAILSEYSRLATSGGGEVSDSPEIPA